MIKKVNLYAALLGMALCGIHAARADTLVTFQVDMTYQVGNNFTPPTDKVFAYGTFNNWASGFQLTNNPSAANTNLYTGTLDVSNNYQGAPVLLYKFVTSSGGFENTVDGNNRGVTLNGSTTNTLYAYYNDGLVGGNVLAPIVSPNITFQVDMAVQVALGNLGPSDLVYVQGSFIGWSDIAANILTNDPSILRTNGNGIVTSNVFTGVIPYTVTPGECNEFKIVLHNGSGDHYESPVIGDQDANNNRILAGPTNDVVQPIIFYSDTPYNPIVTNDVVFQVDMSDQLVTGAFNPSANQVSVVGVFNNWTDNVNVLTNNPGSTNTNVYSLKVRIIDGLGATEPYKFRTGPLGQPNTDPSAGYEPVSNNRQYVMSSNASTTLAVVYFGDVAPPPASDFITNGVTVTFTVNMTNVSGGYVTGYDAHTFDPTVDSVYINGDFTGWAAWSASLPQLTNNPPGSSFYSLTTNFPSPHAVALNYQYSINGVQDETPNNPNHTRYIRNYGTDTLPVDVFGAPVVEQSFGNLAVGQPVAGNVPVTWLGRPGVQLQSAPSVNGPWTTISGTDATSATNSPNSGRKFYRLVHPLLPLE